MAYFIRWKLQTVPQMKKETVYNEHYRPLPSEDMRNNTYKIKISLIIYI